METNKEQNEEEQNPKDQPVSYGKRVLFGKSGKPKVFVKPPLPEGAIDVNELTKIKNRVLRRVWGAAFVLLIAAIIVKQSLYHSSAPWLISLSATLKTYPAFKFVNRFNEGRPEQYFLVLFCGFCFILLVLITILIKLKLDSFVTSGCTCLGPNSDVLRVFLASVFIICCGGFIVFDLMFDPFLPPRKLEILNSVYIDQYPDLLFSYLLVLPAVAYGLVEMSFLFISTILYGFSEKFRTAVDKKVGWYYVQWQ